MQGPNLLRFFKFLLIVVVLLVGFIAALFIASVEEQPLVVATSATQVNDAESVQELIAQIKQSVQDRTLDPVSYTHLTLPTSDLV